MKSNKLKKNLKYFFFPIMGSYNWFMDPFGFGGFFGGGGFHNNNFFQDPFFENQNHSRRNQVCFWSSCGKY
jgi:hypothetical protein